MDLSSLQSSRGTTKTYEDFNPNLNQSWTNNGLTTLSIGGTGNSQIFNPSSVFNTSTYLASPSTSYSAADFLK